MLISLCVVPMGIVGLEEQEEQRLAELQKLTREQLASSHPDQNFTDQQIALGLAKAEHVLAENPLSESEQVVEEEALRAQYPDQVFTDQEIKALLAIALQVLTAEQIITEGASEKQSGAQKDIR